MSSQTFDIIFSGQLIEGNNRDEVKTKIGVIFGADDDLLDKLFSGKPVIIKSGVDDEAATKYRVAFRKAGALIEIKPSTAESASTAPSPKKASNGLTLLPANTGSLIDCAKDVTPQQIPDIDHISLASAGVIIDESPDPEPVQIDTSDLSLNPANSGTLEECTKGVEPSPIPDISHLNIEKQ